MKNLRKLREARKITLKALGDEIGVAESTVSLYETGKREPDIATIKHLADFFHVSTDYLLGFTDDPCFFAGPLAAFIRMRRGETSEESFAQRCKISVELLRRIEEGFRNSDTGTRLHQITSLDTEDMVKIADALGVQWEYIACLHDGFNPKKWGVVRLPEDDRVGNLSDNLLHDVKYAAKRGLSTQEQLLLLAYHMASPSDRDIFDNIVSRYSPSGRTTSPETQPSDKAV